MQNHHQHFVSSSSIASRSNGDNSTSSFAAMLQSSASGNDPFPSQHGHEFKDFTTLTSVNGGSNEYGHLSGGGGHNNNSHHHHHHGGAPHGNNNHHQHGGGGGEPLVNSSSGGGGSHGSGSGSGATKPKKPPPPNGKKTKGRVKIKMEFIDNKLRRYTTFSKRKTGIMKKAYELSTLTGTQVMLLVASETGHVYTFATRKLQPMITSEAGKALIQTCLNSPDPPNSGSDAQRMSATGYEETELTYAADPNGSDHDVKVRLSTSPYSSMSGQPPGSMTGLGGGGGQLGPPLHHPHSPSLYGSPLNNNYHPGSVISGGGGPGGAMMFPHSPSPNSQILYHYPSDPQPPQCYPQSGLHSPSSPHLTHLAR